MANSHVIVEFKTEQDLNDWYIVDDAVMGGLSKGKVKLEGEAACFYGHVSLENNGGFSSLMHRTNSMTFENKDMVKLTVKGDGKNYQFRLKKSAQDYESYITTFSTNGKWQTIEIKLNSLYPSFRGRKLDKPNFSGNEIGEIRFLIANKVEEDFKLLIKKIELI